jgi:YD repeat-containing protein
MTDVPRRQTRFAYDLTDKRTGVTADPEWRPRGGGAGPPDASQPRKGDALTAEITAKHLIT